MMGLQTSTNPMDPFLQDGSLGTIAANPTGNVLESSLEPAHCARRARGRPTIVPSALRFRLMVSMLMGGFLLCGAAARVPAPEPRQGQPAPTGESPQWLSALPKVCVDSHNLGGNVSKMLNALRDHASAEAWNTLGPLYAQRGTFVCAIPAFEAALRLQPDSRDARYNLALAWIKGGQPIKAAQELQTLIQQKPQFVAAHFALGILLRSQGKPDYAESEFEAAIRSDPHFYAAYLNLADLLESEGRYAAATFRLEQALALNPPKDVAAPLQTTMRKVQAEGQRVHAPRAGSNPDQANLITRPTSCWPRARSGRLSTPIAGPCS